MPKAQDKGSTHKDNQAKGNNIQPDDGQLHQERSDLLTFLEFVHGDNFNQPVPELLD